MPRRLPPALEAATRTHEATAAAWRAHRQMCDACNRANKTTTPRRACDDGYRLWQADTRARAEEERRRAHSDAQAQLQLTLT
jgi:hypothetical protein